MLKLDEKKIRKGKAVGLPYVGSKKKVSKKIVEIIKQNFGTDKTVYDLFGGGGAVSLEMKLNGFNEVHYNELDKMTVAAFNAAMYEDFDIRYLIATREEFFEIRNSNHDGIDELKLLTNSFGNDRRSYLYSKIHSEQKTALAKKIVKEEKEWRNYKQTSTYKEYTINKSKYFNTIEQIGRIQQIERIQRVDGDITVTNKDYKEFSGLNGALIYLDPPYENATNEYQTGKFDSVEFYNLAYEMSKNNIVIISSYEVIDERFNPVFEFENAHSMLSAKGVGNRTEKLFMVKC